MKSFERFDLPLKLKKIEYDIELEMKKGANKNKDLLRDLAKQKKEMSFSLDSFAPDRNVMPLEDLLVDCENLLNRLGSAYIEALADDSGSDESIDKLIEKVKILKESLT